MRTIIAGPRPPEIEALIERRRANGADRYDEVWDGEYHMAPMAHGRHGWLDAELAVVLHTLAGRAGLRSSGGINLGEPDDFRVPDRAVLRSDSPPVVWHPTAALVVEIVSPDDESWAKFDFYAEHGVDEVVIVDPQTRLVHWFARGGSTYDLVERSAVLDVAVAEVAEQITWPPTESD